MLLWPSPTEMPSDCKKNRRATYMYLYTHTHSHTHTRTHTPRRLLPLMPCKSATTTGRSCVCSLPFVHSILLAPALQVVPCAIRAFRCCRDDYRTLLFASHLSCKTPSARALSLVAQLVYGRSLDGFESAQ